MLGTSSKRGHGVRCKHTLYKLCAFPVRMCIPGEAHPHSQWGCAILVSHIPILGDDMHSRWGISPFPVRMCIPGEAHLPSQWGYAFRVRHTSLFLVRMYIPGVAHPHSQWGWTSSLGMHILTRNGDVPHWECISSPGMGMCLTRNAHPHRECVSSPGMRILTGNAYPHRECVSSPGMNLVYWGWSIDIRVLENFTWIFLFWAWFVVVTWNHFLHANKQHYECSQM